MLKYDFVEGLKNVKIIGLGWKCGGVIFFCSHNLDTTDGVLLVNDVLNVSALSWLGNRVMGDHVPKSSFKINLSMKENIINKYLVTVVDIWFFFNV